MLHLYYVFDVVIQPTPTAKFLQGYVGAVTSAVSIAVSPWPSLGWCLTLLQVHTIGFLHFKCAYQND